MEREVFKGKGVQYKPLSQRRHFLRGAQINARNVNANECPCECGAHSHTHTHIHECPVSVFVCVYPARLLWRSATFSRVANASALSVPAYEPPGASLCLPPSLSLSLAQSPSLTLSPCLLLGLVVKYILGSLAVWLVVDFLSSSYRYPPFLW